MTSRFLATRLLFCLLLVATPSFSKPPTKKAAPSKSATPPKHVSLVMELSAARALPVLSKQAKPALLAIQAKLEAGEHAQAKAAFAAFIKAEKPSEAKALAIARWLIRAAVLDKNSKLADAGDRARFHSEQQRALRAHVSELRTLRHEETAPFQVKHLILTPTYARGAVAFRYATTATALTLAQLDALIAKLEEQRKSVGDMSQAMQLDLQDAMQNEQHGVLTMSAMLKSLHDTAKAIINNAKA